MKKVLMCEFGGLGEAGIRKSFERMGIQVVEYYRDTENHDYDKHFLEELAPMIDEEKPDFVFSINFLPIVSKICKIYGVLYICWIYDCPELHLYSKAVQNQTNRIFIFDKLQYQRFNARSPHNTFYLPLATETMTEDDIRAITSEEWKQYSRDITYIGSLYNDTDRSNRYSGLDKLPPYWKGYVEGLVQAQLQVYGYNFIAESLSDKAVEELEKLLPYALVDDYENVYREIIADKFIGDYCSALDRFRTLKSVARKQALTIYTGSDTRQLEKESLHKIENCGLADSVTMMPKIFHCSKINLNITSKTISSGIPLRVFDVLGSKGFLISNYQPELSEWFSLGEDLVVYEDLEDLNLKIEYYLQHEDERIAIAEHGYRTVCENYTYDRLLGLILEECGITV